jgi:hypothetical protein
VCVFAMTPPPLAPPAHAPASVMSITTSTEESDAFRFTGFGSLGFGLTIGADDPLAPAPVRSTPVPAPTPPARPPAAAVPAVVGCASTTSTTEESDADAFRFTGLGLGLGVTMGADDPPAPAPAPVRSIPALTSSAWPPAAVVTAVVGSATISTEESDAFRFTGLGLSGLAVGAEPLAPARSMGAVTPACTSAASPVRSTSAAAGSLPLFLDLTGAIVGLWGESSARGWQRVREFQLVAKANNLRTSDGGGAGHFKPNVRARPVINTALTAAHAATRRAPSWPPPAPRRRRGYIAAGGGCAGSSEHVQSIPQKAVLLYTAPLQGATPPHF